MPGSITMYTAAPWTVESASRWMVSELGWRSPDPRKPTYLESVDGGRAWVEPADADTRSIGSRLGGFTPSIYILFKPRLSVPGGVRRMMATVFAFCDDSPDVLLLYQSETVLLQASAGRRYVPPAARDWWRGEDVSDLIG